MRAGLRRLPAPGPEQLPRLEVAEVGLCGTEPSGLLHCQKASPSRGMVRGGQGALKTTSGLRSAQARPGFVGSLGSQCPALGTHSARAAGRSVADGRTFARVVGSPQGKGSCAETGSPHPRSVAVLPNPPSRQRCTKLLKSPATHTETDQGHEEHRESGLETSQVTTRGLPVPTGKASPKLSPRPSEMLGRLSFHPICGATPGAAWVLAML